MSDLNNVRLWRVEWVHRRGYRAPSKYVEAKKREEANKMARETSRLRDFPDFWRFELVLISSQRVNGKWLISRS